VRKRNPAVVGGSYSGTTVFRRSKTLWAVPLLVWLILILASLGWNVYSLTKNVHTTFKNEARTLSEVVLSVMLWAEKHGQVYLPVSEWIPKEPFYVPLKYRDVETTCGLRLTQVSPGGIVHQQAELGWLHGLTRKSIRVVSLQSADHTTAPSQWESEALGMFQRGLAERSGIVTDAGDAVFKYMVPIKIKSAQGFGGGEVVGGVSVSERAETRFAVIRPHIIGVVTAHILFFSTVGFAIFFLLFHLRRQGLLLDEVNGEQTAMIAKLHASERMLEEMSVTDELTGLLNRRGFFAAAPERLHTAQPDNRRWMIFIDIDGLKSVNDKWGHDEGDKLITATAAILRQTFRGSDLIARMGGDEFVVMISEPDASCASVILTRLQNNIDTYNVEHNTSYRLSLSAGVVDCDACKKRCSVDELLKMADELMYLRKRAAVAAQEGRETAASAE